MDAQVQGPQWPGAPPHLLSPTGTAKTKSSTAKPRDAARTSDRRCARCLGTGFSCLQEGCTKVFSKERLQGEQCWKGVCHLPPEGVSSCSSHDSGMPYGDPVWQGTTADPRVMPKPVICLSVSSSRHSSDGNSAETLFILLLTLHHTWTLSLHTKPALCVSAALPSPKGHVRWIQILLVHNAPGQISIFVDQGCKMCTLQLHMLWDVPTKLTATLH